MEAALTYILRTIFTCWEHEAQTRFSSVNMARRMNRYFQDLHSSGSEEKELCLCVMTLLSL